ncbi:glycosyltransferase family 2 protein [Paenibacillus rubinfantis]|uniref:glycosyltransferase family 2 protein n=1 Tax=Paenibacillus rubinfantis TaxID=1720296 RepID=UPI00073E702F|nr:glycosyltransferase [Paenibacillus rubinfantis]
MTCVSLLTILLSWNRPELLEQTINSYHKTITCTFKLVVVDNGSDTETTHLLSELSQKFDFDVLYLEENIGGEAFNLILDRDYNYKYVHFSENDLEYLPGWDEQIIKKLNLFHQIGQISLFSPVPQTEIGEIWEAKNAKLISREGLSFYITDQNVGTSSVVRKELIEQGLRWSNFESGQWRFPADGQFSGDVRRLGWYVAWNDRYLVTNWGHNIQEFEKNLEYYLSNYKAKTWFSIEGLKERLLKNGYRLVEDGEKSKLIKID